PPTFTIPSWPYVIECVQMPAFVSYGGVWASVFMPVSVSLFCQRRNGSMTPVPEDWIRFVFVQIVPSTELVAVVPAVVRSIGPNAYAVLTPRSAATAASNTAPRIILNPPIRFASQRGTARPPDLLALGTTPVEPRASYSLRNFGKYSKSHVTIANRNFRLAAGLCGCSAGRNPGQLFLDVREDWTRGVVDHVVLKVDPGPVVLLGLVSDSSALQKCLCCNGMAHIPADHLVHRPEQTLIVSQEPIAPYDAPPVKRRICGRRIPLDQPLIGLDGLPD